MLFVLWVALVVVTVLLIVTLLMLNSSHEKISELKKKQDAIVPISELFKPGNEIYVHRIVHVGATTYAFVTHPTQGGKMAVTYLDECISTIMQDGQVVISAEVATPGYYIWEQAHKTGFPSRTQNVLVRKAKVRAASVPVRSPRT